MSGFYRVELSKTGRAGCASVQCKKGEVKIGKGELRQGVSVVVQEHTSMKWRHWGCVTPQVLHNWKEKSEGDMDLVDGYDDLPEDAQKKVKRAFDQLHVDDEDWNGDIEMNRYDPDQPKKGMFLTEAAKKKMGIKGDDEDKPAKKSAKKRKQAEDDEEEVEEKPTAKKPRAKKAKGEDEVAKPPAKKSKKSAKAGKAAVSDEAEAHDPDGDDKVDAAPAKKPKGRKPKSAAKIEPSSAPNVEEDEAEPSSPIKAKKAAATKQPQKRKGRGRKAAAEVDEE